MATSPPRLPLEGVKILDLTRALAGPMATALLADLGADVIKVEPIEGEMIRRWAPFDQDTSLYDVSVNRNKRSLTVNFRSESGKSLLRRLALESDVLVENFRPGVLEQLGLCPENLSRDAQHLIVARMSGFGPVGPLRDEPCFDQIVQGMAGLMSLTGDPNGQKYRVGIPIADILSGMFTAIAIAAALSSRGTGRGTNLVETSLLESALGVLTFQAQRYLSLGDVAPAAGNDHPVLSPYGVFATSDVPINIAAATDDQYERLTDVIGAPDMKSDPRFSSSRDRTAHREELREELEAVLKSASASEWEERLRAARIPVGPVQDMAGVFNHLQVQAVGMVTNVDHGTLGSTDVLRGPFRIDGQPVPVRRAAPLLGEHSLEVLQQFGFSEPEVQQLVADATVGVPTDSST
jgi:crotonobetainyl-CoA:carnitine CoA-transferase CaiB-like acyl-CoA transferase